MYFGLTNSLATFQTIMNEIFQDLITKGVISVYLDDILMFTNSLEEHCRITCLVLDCMREHKLYLWPEKCELEKTKIEYLSDNLNTTQTPECSKGKYNVKIRKQKSLLRSHQQPM
jgi:hypothetical protein